MLLVMICPLRTWTEWARLALINVRHCTNSGLFRVACSAAPYVIYFCPAHRALLILMCTVSNLKDKLSAGGRPVDYYGAVEWMACPVVAHTFMSTYMENSRDFTGDILPPL